MKANPKTVWVMLNNHEPYYVDKKESFSLTEGWSCVPYHLHPGNEVARAQIVKDLNYLYECPSRMGAAMVAKRFGVGFKGMRFV